MIVRNERRFLADALASVRGVVDELCIVDTGSTDGTVALAESFGARVKSVAWRDDFAWARNEALALARHAWIFVLDADERLSPESREALAALGRSSPDGNGRWVRCLNLSDDARGTGAGSNAIVRLFPNDPRIRYRGKIHEFPAREGEPHSLGALISPIEIVHHGYLSDVTAARDKAERNVRVSLAAYEADPDDAANVYNYATALVLAGDLAGARRELERCCAMTEKTPRGFRPQALLMLAGRQIADAEPELALSTIDRCTAICPTLSDAHFLRGKVLASLGKFYAARDAFGAAIAASKHDDKQFLVDNEIGIWKAANEIAATLMREERWREALAWVEAALESRPAAQALVINRARCREALGDLELAEAGFRAAMDGYRDERSAIEYVNFLFRHAGPDVALAGVEAALPHLGDDYRRAFLVSVAAVMLRAGRVDAGRALVGRALEIGEPAFGRATVVALAGQFAYPELRSLLPEEGEQLAAVAP